MTCLFKNKPIKLAETRNLRMPPMEAVASSSSSSFRPPQHQVFINFRGDELRKNFVSHLVKDLRKARINAFIDSDERRGEDLSKLLQRIEESRIVLVIFSVRYTESEWCLDELAKIQERVDRRKLKVIPIFYNVATEDVKRLKGKFGDHFRELKWQHRHDGARILRWEDALISVAGKMGFTLENQSSESDLVDSIVKEVKEVLVMIPPEKSEHLYQERGKMPESYPENVAFPGNKEEAEQTPRVIPSATGNGANSESSSAKGNKPHFGYPINIRRRNGEDLQSSSSRDDRFRGDREEPETNSTNGLTGTCKENPESYVDAEPKSNETPRREFSIGRLIFSCVFACYMPYHPPWLSNLINSILVAFILLMILYDWINDRMKEANDF